MHLVTRDIISIILLKELYEAKDMYVDCEGLFTLIRLRKYGVTRLTKPHFHIEIRINNSLRGHLFEAHSIVVVEDSTLFFKFFSFLHNKSQNFCQKLFPDCLLCCCQHCSIGQTDGKLCFWGHQNLKSGLLVLAVMIWLAATEPCIIIRPGKMRESEVY